MDADYISEPINLSCHVSTFRDGEHFNGIHNFGIVLSGILELNDGKQKKCFKEGSLYFAAKNHLIKFIKHPPENGEFKSITFFLDTEFLKDYSSKNDIQYDVEHTELAFLSLGSNRKLVSLAQSLAVDEKVPENQTDKEWYDRIRRQALKLLLEQEPHLGNILFNFNTPHKIDLESFMNENFHFNVHLERFAFLTGRSLATFKRDFEKIFHTAPRQWLQNKRLERAHHLLAAKEQSVSNIYLDLGFENLSHFSYAFKKKFGYAPTNTAFGNTSANK